MELGTFKKIFGDLPNYWIIAIKDDSGKCRKLSEFEVHVFAPKNRPDGFFTKLKKRIFGVTKN